jgi:hypothetical protein
MIEKIIELIEKIFHPIIQKSINRIDERRKHDAARYYNIESILREKRLVEFLELLGSDHSYYSFSRMEFVSLVQYYSLISSHFIEENLDNAMKTLCASIEKLLVFIGSNFWVYPNDQKEENHRLCLYPNLNPDREGTNDPVEVQRYQEYADKLIDLIREVDVNYKKYRLLIKKELFI